MADILPFQSSRAGDTSRDTRPDAGGYSFWPEVECGMWRRQPEPDPANAPKRVVLEIALILGGTAALCLLTNLLAAPSFH